MKWTINLPLDDFNSISSVITRSAVAGSYVGSCACYDSVLCDNSVMLTIMHHLTVHYVPTVAPDWRSPGIYTMVSVEKTLPELSFN